MSPASHGDMSEPSPLSYYRQTIPEKVFLAIRITPCYSSTQQAASAAGRLSIGGAHHFLKTQQLQVNNESGLWSRSVIV